MFRVLIFFFALCGTVFQRAFRESHFIHSWFMILKPKPVKNVKTNHFLVEIRLNASKTLVFRFSRETEAKIFADLLKNLKEKVHLKASICYINYL